MVGLKCKTEKNKRVEDVRRDSVITSWRAICNSVINCCPVNTAMQKRKHHVNQTRHAHNVLFVSLQYSNSVIARQPIEKSYAERHCYKIRRTPIPC